MKTKGAANGGNEMEERVKEMDVRVQAKIKLIKKEQRKGNMLAVID